MDKSIKLNVGQKVAVRIVDRSNASRGMNMTLDNIETWCFDGEVVKAGRKYVTVTFNKYLRYPITEQFEIDQNYRQKYTCGSEDYCLYLNKEIVIEMFKAKRLYLEIKERYFSNYFTNLILNLLERIKSIIEGNSLDDSQESDQTIAKSVLVVSVNYDGNDVSTYNGIEAKNIKGQVDQVNTGNFDDDLNTVREKYKNCQIFCSSTIDHFIMDR